MFITTHQPPANTGISRLLLYFLCCLLLLLFLTGCTVGGVDVEQERASGLLGELVDGQQFGQTFTLTHRGLYRLDLYTATYARDNNQPVIFRIRSAPEAPDLVRLEIPAAQISNSGPTIITFPPLAETAGRTLYFSIESPGSVAGNAITVYREEREFYAGGQMFLNGQPAGGDLAFIAYTQQVFSLTRLGQDFYARAGQDKPFFIGYGLLLGVLLTTLVLLLIMKSPRVESEKSTEEADLLPQERANPHLTMLDS